MDPKGSAFGGGSRGAKPPGGFQGSALTFLPSPDCPEAMTAERLLRRPERRPGRNAMMASTWLDEFGGPNALERCPGGLLQIANALCVGGLIFADHALAVGRDMAADPADAVKLQTPTHSLADRIEVILSERRIETALDNNA